MKITVLLEALTGSFDTDIDKSASKAERRFNKLADEFDKKAKIIGTAAAAAAAAIALLTKSQIDQADRIFKLSQSTGIAVDLLSSYELAAELAGMSIDDLATSLGKLARTANDAATGAKGPKEAFAALGVEVTDTEGRLKSLDVLLGDVAEAFAGIEDGTAK